MKTSPLTQAEKTALAFCVGYHHGFARTRDGMLSASPRAVRERFPAWTREQVDAYLNGEDDARAYDDFRFRRFDAAIKKAALSL